MQRPLHDHMDLLTGLNTAFDDLIAGRQGAARRALHATLVSLPWASAHRDQVEHLLTSAGHCNSHDAVTTLLLDIHALVECLGQEPRNVAHAV